MARLGCLGLIIVLLVVGWDQWRIEQMRREVHSIASKVHIESKNNKPKSGGNNDLVTSLAQAEMHTRKAKELMRKKHYKEAQAELDWTLKNLNSANNVSQDIVGDTAEYMGKARERAIELFQTAWKDIAEEAKKQKVDVKSK